MKDYAAKMEELMMEDPEIENRRQSLIDRRKKLLQIKSRLPDVIAEDIDEDELLDGDPADEVLYVMEEEGF